MGEYGNGVSFARAEMLDKERIKHALNGELIVGECEEGFMYGHFPKEDCDAYILSAFDNAVYHALQSMQSSRAVDRILEEKGIAIPMVKYMQYVEEIKYNDNISDDRYVFESEKDEEDDDTLPNIDDKLPFDEVD